MKSDSTQGAPAGGEEPDFGVGCEDMEEVAACGTASVRMGDRSMHTDLTSVERRLAELESVVGDGEVAGLYPDLCTALDTMETRLSLLDPATLQAVGAEVSNLEERLSKVESQEANAADSTEMGGGGLFAHGRLQRLSDAVDRWDSVSHVLPSLLARLRTLRSVHEEASGVVLDVQQLKQVHASTGMALRAQVGERGRESMRARERGLVWRARLFVAYRAVHAPVHLLDHSFLTPLCLLTSIPPLSYPPTSSTAPLISSPRTHAPTRYTGSGSSEGRTELVRQCFHDGRQHRLSGRTSTVSRVGITVS
jgi:hypothetical protein